MIRVARTLFLMLKCNSFVCVSVFLYISTNIRLCCLYSQESFVMFNSNVIYSYKYIHKIIIKYFKLCFFIFCLFPLMLFGVGNFVHNLKCSHYGYFPQNIYQKNPYYIYKSILFWN